MKVIKYPAKEEWKELVKRPHLDVSHLNATVEGVLEDVRNHGDEAVKRYEEKFDHAHLDSLSVSEAEMDEAEHMVSAELKHALELAHHNIARFHESQKFEGSKVETCPATPAKVAGCEEIVLCTPPNAEGKVNPAILMAAKIAGVSKIFKAGGVQAIGAMAYGTESVPKVYKIFGPGNQFVIAAKQHVSLHDVAIDMPAGPSEVCVIADESSNPVFVAADLLSQAEHGFDSQVFFITTSEERISKVVKEVEQQLERLPRKEMAHTSLDNSKFILVKDKQEAIDLSNAYAPEHLIIATSDFEQLAEKVVNAGSVFLGNYACESAGDYASGTNHTLPTHGYALAYNGVNLDSYNRKITFQHLSKEGIRSIGKAVVTMAENEQLEAHANAMRLRVESLGKK